MPRYSRTLEDGTKVRQCGRCKEWKLETEEFFYFRLSRQQWESTCRECKKTYQREYGHKTYTKDNPSMRNSRLKYLYDITTDEYEQLLTEQNGVCAVCESFPSDRYLSVDHCHITGRVRGLLCYKCNTAAGQLGDDPKLALKLSIYLER